MSGRPADPDPGAPRLRTADAGDPVVLLVTGFASGFLRPAPGTWGTLAALAVWWWVLGTLSWQVQLAVVAVTVAAGIWLTGIVGRRYGVHDDPRIVIDEFAGLWIALLGMPVSIGWALAGFLLFRLLDIVKVWPVGWADRRVSGGLGVMLDDVIAGGLARGVLQLAILLAASPALGGSS